MRRKQEISEIKAEEKCFRKSQIKKKWRKRRNKKHEKKKTIEYKETRVRERMGKI